MKILRFSVCLAVATLLALISGADATDATQATGEIVFKNDPEAATVYYVIEADTLRPLQNGNPRGGNAKLVVGGLGKRPHVEIFPTTL